MSSKTMVWIGVFVGGFIGGWIPTLFGVGMFSPWGLVGNTLGAFAGIWFVVKFIGI